MLRSAPLDLAPRQAQAKLKLHTHTHHTTPLFGGGRTCHTWPTRQGQPPCLPDAMTNALANHVGGPVSRQPAPWLCPASMQRHLFNNNRLDNTTVVTDTRASAARRRLEDAASYA